MATKTKAQIITDIDTKIITNGDIKAVDTNTILKDILEFSDKPLASIKGFDFGNMDKPLQTANLHSVKVNFRGIEEHSCSLYLCIQANLKEIGEVFTHEAAATAAAQKVVDWLFIPLNDKEYEILLSFLPNINEKQMYLTFTVPFLRAQNKASETKSAFNFPLMIIAMGLLTNKEKQKGLHIILPEPGFISTSLTLLYKPNQFEYELLPKEMQETINNFFDSILKDNDLILDN
jgi:hypothetical protein